MPLVSGRETVGVSRARGGLLAQRLSCGHTLTPPHPSHPGVDQPGAKQAELLQLVSCRDSCRRSLLPWGVLSAIVCGSERITPTVSPLRFHKLLGCHLLGMAVVSSRKANLLFFFFSLGKHN